MFKQSLGTVFKKLALDFLRIVIIQCNVNILYCPYVLLYKNQVAWYHNTPTLTSAQELTRSNL